MTMKTVKIVVAAAFCFTATMAQCDETFDSLVKLANTPISQITTTNAVQVLDAAIATTNANAVVNVVKSKAIAYAEVFAKAKDNANCFKELCGAAKNYGTEEEQIASFQNFADTWLVLDENTQYKYLAIFSFYSTIKTSNGYKCMSVSAIDAVVTKLVASNSPWKAQAITPLLYRHKAYWTGPLSKHCEECFDLVKATVLNGTNEYAFEFAKYIANVKKDYALASQMIDNIELYRKFGTTSSKCPFLAFVMRQYEPTLSKLRKQYLESIAKNDTQLITVAQIQDIVDGNKNTTASIFGKLKDTTTKLETALYLNDNDKLIDTLLTIDNTIAPEKIEKAVSIINTFDPDYRTADVLKALRIINKKYTLKLYDDRDTWEPILSKVRALIDVYNN